jgi:cytochrome c biogenesis protein CcmG/thiol:disulfide interchange protein DsbE
LDREAAVKAGLLNGFEAHVVSSFNGETLLRYRESDGRPEGATINDTHSGTSEFITNPQLLGLSTSLFIESTVRNCLAYEEAKSMKLIGMEPVEGIPAWRVEVLSKYNNTLNFWIDAAHPERLLKQSCGQDEVLSRYDRSGSPIPSEIIRKDYRNGKPRMEIRYVLSNVKFDVSVPASTWTLAGLGMKIGTSVSDNRVSRTIGYWNGAGLSTSPPRKDAEPEPAPDVAELLALIENLPASVEAFEAARWILFNTPDGAEVEKAADAIRREHLENTNVVALCKRLESARYRCSTNLLELFLEKNPSAEVRANTCFLLATLKKEEAQFGKNEKATAAAVKLFERVINEFGKAKALYAIDLARKAKAHLDELRQLLVGMTAPDFDGTGFDGEQIRSRDYRGRVVVLVFWCCGYSEAPEHAKFLTDMEGKPVALIGVSCDENLKRAREGLAQYDITWPNIWDKRDGPIATAWNVQSWPNIWVLDGKGVIRFRNVRGVELVKAVETLLAE